MNPENRTPQFILVEERPDGKYEVKSSALGLSYGTYATEEQAKKKQRQVSAITGVKKGTARRLARSASGKTKD